MFAIDDTQPSISVNLAVLTVSDTRTFDNDKSGQTLVNLITEAGHQVVERAIVPDNQNAIVQQLQAWIADTEIDAIISTGGTGITGRDVTPEAFQDIRRLPKLWSASTLN